MDLGQTAIRYLKYLIDQKWIELPSPSEKENVILQHIALTKEEYDLFHKRFAASTTNESDENLAFAILSVYCENKGPALWKDINNVDWSGRKSAEKDKRGENEKRN